MKNIFIVPGYGIPKDILKDEPYRRYLGLVFNCVYQICLDKKENKPVIIFCGGKTDVFKPYKRTEAAEMKKLFFWFAQRDFVKKYTKGWQYKLENSSLSTLENILFANKIIEKIKVDKNIFIFVEKTRENKIKVLTEKIVKNKTQIISLDFDLSINRYREIEFLIKRESYDLGLSLKILADEKLYKIFRKILLERIEYLRKAGSKKHREAVHVWWQEKIRELKNN